MGSSCVKSVTDCARDELWGYFALFGLLFLHIGIVLMVYALKEATPYPIALETLGISLMVFGLVAILVSWYVHRKRRQRTELCICNLCCTAMCCVCRRKAIMGDSTGGYARETNHSKERRPPLTPYSTPEFQRYAEFLKKDSAGVEEDQERRNGQRFKMESPRQKKNVHPVKTCDPSPVTGYANAIYSENNQTDNDAMAVMHPVVQLSK